MRILAMFSAAFAAAAALCAYAHPAAWGWLPGLCLAALAAALLLLHGDPVRRVRTIALGLAAGFLWCWADAGRLVSEMEGSHVQLGVELARKYNESPDVIHAIEAHHNDVEPRTVIACLVQAADAISAARPGARRENVENYIRRLEKLEELTGTYPGVEKSYAIQAGREVRIMVKPEDVSEDNMIILARELTKKIESELEYPGQIKVNVIRETKVVEYAK